MRALNLISPVCALISTAAMCFAGRLNMHDSTYAGEIGPYIEFYGGIALFLISVILFVFTCVSLVIDS